MYKLIQYLKDPGPKVSIELSNGNFRLGYIIDTWPHSKPKNKENKDLAFMEIEENRDTKKPTKSTYIPINQVVAITQLTGKNNKIEDPEDVVKSTKSDQSDQPNIKNRGLAYRLADKIPENKTIAGKSGGI